MIKTNNFLIIPKTKAIFLLAKQIEKIYFYKKEKNFYINNIKKINLVDIVKYVKTNQKQVNLKSVYSIYTQLRSRIQLTQSEFKIIKFTNSKKCQIEELIVDKDVIAYLADKLVVLNNKSILFIKNVEYA